ncbi:MAG TPA: hypothetical protein VFX16_34165 [Pseudonocardiaceae bacterium]|nr:hypothetical protein [Pseudonocardiaceae bacterium]
MTGSLPPTGPPGAAGWAGAPDSADEGIAGSVTGEWVEVYPPDGVDDRAKDEPELVPELRSRLSPIATGLYGVSLVLVLLGSVLPLFRATEQVSFRTLSDINVSAWQATVASLGPEGQLVTNSHGAVVPMGYPLIVAALLLVATLALWLRAGWRPASIRPARLVGVVTATFLVGLVFALGMFELTWLNLFGTGGIGAGGGLSAGAGQGFWVLLVGALAAIAAVVLSFRTPIEDVVPEEEWDDEPAEVPPGQPAEWPVVAVIPADERTNW